MIKNPFEGLFLRTNKELPITLDKMEKLSIMIVIMVALRLLDQFVIHDEWFSTLYSVLALVFVPYGGYILGISFRDFVLPSERAKGNINYPEPEKIAQMPMFYDITSKATKWAIENGILYHANVMCRGSRKKSPDIVEWLPFPQWVIDFDAIHPFVKKYYGRNGDHQELRDNIYELQMEFQQLWFDYFQRMYPKMSKGFAANKAAIMAGTAATLGSSFMLVIVSAFGDEGDEDSKIAPRAKALIKEFNLKKYIDKEDSELVDPDDIFFVMKGVNSRERNRIVTDAQASSIFSLSPAANAARCSCADGAAFDRSAYKDIFGEV